jgi:hypothetical protein
MLSVGEYEFFSYLSIQETNAMHNKKQRVDFVYKNGTSNLLEVNFSIALNLKILKIYNFLIIGSNSKLNLNHKNKELISMYYYGNLFIPNQITIKYN